MKRREVHKETWKIELTATDGRHCHWTFENMTLHRVKDIIKGYVDSCPYDCEWVISGASARICGKIIHPEL